MDRANKTGMIISTLLIASILGAITGLVWAFALSYPIKTGLFFGAIIGVIVGLLLSLFQKAATAPGNVQEKEAMFVSGSMMGLIFMGITAVGIIVGLIRWIFF